MQKHHKSKFQVFQDTWIGWMDKWKMLDGKIYLTFDISPEFYTKYYTDKQVTKKKLTR